MKTLKVVTWLCVIVAVFDLVLWGYLGLVATDPIDGSRILNAAKSVEGLVSVTVNLALLMPYIARRFWRHVSSFIAGLSWRGSLLVGEVLVGIVVWNSSGCPKLDGKYGDLLCDDFLSVRIEEPTRGHPLAESRYSVSLEVKNRTSLEVSILSLVAEFRNDNLLDVSGREVLFTANDHATLFLRPHTKAVIPIEANEYLPRKVHVSLRHSMGASPSSFDIDLGGIVVPFNCLGSLPKDAWETGANSLDAIRRASTVAQRWNGNARLAAAFPGTNSVFLDQSSGLKYIRPEGWVVSFCAQGNAMFIVNVSGQEEPAGVPSDQPCEWLDAPAINVGHHEAIRRASESGRTCRPWRDDMRLIVTKMHGTPIAAWQLPYMDKLGRIVWVDANNGHQMVLRGVNAQRRFERASD